MLHRDPGLQRAAAALALLALATAALSLLLGVPVYGRQFAYDSGFAIASLAGFDAELLQGIWWPRWLHGGNFGLGSPTFYFYPPLAYWVAAAIGRAADLPAPAALAASVAFWRALALATAFLWLRGHHDRGSALAGAALAALFPYASLVNPWLRFGYAEVAAAALVPLLLLAIDRNAAARDARRLPVVSLAFAALALTHLPATAMAAVFGLLYAWGLGGWRSAVRTALGGALALLLAGAFLVPALALTPEANPGGLYLYIQEVARPLFLDLPTAENRRLIGQYAAFVAAVFGVAWLLRGRWRSLPFRAPGHTRAALLLFLGTAVAMTPLGWPLWMEGSPLRAVQHPWRAMSLMGPAFGAVSALALAAGAPSRRAVMAGLDCLLPFGFLWANVRLGDPNWPRFLPAEDHLAWARAQPSSYPAEHWPAAAVAAGWLDPGLGPRAGRGWPPPSVRELPAEPLWRHSPPEPPEGARRIPGGWWVPRAGPEPFELPQLWFPSWGAVSAQGPVATRASPATGFVEVLPGRQVEDLRVVVGRTRWETIGWWLSGLGALALVASALLARKPLLRNSAAGVRRVLEAGN